MALMELELRSGQMDSAREILAQLLQRDPSFRTRIVDLAWTLAPSSPEAAFVCIDTAVDAELATGNYMDAAALLQEFVTRASGQITALLKLVEICVDGGLEATMYEAQAGLADAYLESGHGAEARVIAEDLVAREPWEHAHIDRFRRALVMLDVPDPDMLIAERLSGHGPFVATDPFMPPESFGPPDETPRSEADTPSASEPEPVAIAPAAAEVDEPEPEKQTAEPQPEAPGEPALSPRHGGAAPRVSGSEPDIPLRPRTPDAAPPKPGKAPGGLDIDLTEVLAELQGMTKPLPPKPGATPSDNLDDAFGEFRSAVSKQTGAHEAGEKLTLAKTYLEMGMTDEAMAALADAAKVPTHRFEAGSILGRLYQKKNDLPHAAEWLERAAEAPAPTANEGRELLYDLGAILEVMGETARALSVFLELQTEAGEYRDVAARVERLARVQTGG
jgi:hypothetical protein